MKRFLLAILLVCSAACAFSLDFGLLADQRFEASNTGIGYNPLFIPWFSLNTSQGLSLYLSGLLSMQYRKPNDSSDGSWGKPVLVPELSRFALGYRRAGFSTNSGPFVAVTGITNVPATVSTGIPPAQPSPAVPSSTVYGSLGFRVIHQ